MRLLEWTLRLVASLAVAVLLIGFPTVVLEAPQVTRALVTRFYDPSSAGVPLPDALRAAEAVRVYVTDAAARPLPTALDGRAAFDDAAASHLRDVRGVLLGARTATIAAALAAAALLGVALARKNLRSVAWALRAGALGTFVVAVLSALWGAVDFERFFTAFHGLFFSAGTWTFPEGSLLIQLFPEPLWATLGAFWAAGVLLGGAVMLIAAQSLSASRRGQAREEV